MSNLHCGGDNMDAEYEHPVFHAFVDEIKSFEKSLPQDQEVGLVYSGFTFSLDMVSITKGGILSLSGHCADGQAIRLCFREPSLQLLIMIGLPRQAKDKPRRPLGFLGN